MATSEDKIKYENFVRFLMAKNAEFIKRGKTEALENLAIFHFIIGHFVLAKMYGSDNLKSVIRMLEMHKTVIKMKGTRADEKISILAAHQKILLRMKETILRRINEGDWDDKKGPSEAVEDYRRFNKSAPIIDEIMVVLVKKLAKSLKKFKDTEPKFIEYFMKVRI